MSRGYAGVGLIAPKVTHNVGGVMRAAECFDAALIVLQGPRYQRIPTDVRRAWRHRPLIVTDDLWKMVPFDCCPVAVEFLPDAQPLGEFHHPERGFYIFGPEDGTLPSKILDRCKNVVAIPTNGCLNLAATVNVVLYDRMVKRQ